MEVLGTIKEVGAVRTGAKKDGSEWKMQSVVVTYKDGSYDKNLEIGMPDAHIGKHTVGETIKCQCNVSSRKWQDKWFTSVSAWKVESQGGGQPAQQAQSEGTGDLPF